MRDPIDNLREWRLLADDDDVGRGTEWYANAREWALTLAVDYGVTLETAAAVIAVLSPNCDWPANIRASSIVVANHAGGRPMPTGIAGVYPDNVAKAWRILSEGVTACNATRVNNRGRLVACHGRRHGCYAALHGPKVYAFWRTILGNLDETTLDVWATRAGAVSPSEIDTLASDDPRRNGKPAGRWESLQTAYRSLAGELGEHPAVTQAIVWIVIRNIWKRSDGRLQGVRRNAPRAWTPIGDTDIPF